MNRRKLGVFGGAMTLLVTGVMVWRMAPVQAYPELGNMAAYWRFDESTAGSTASDDTNRGNDLTPTNSPTPSTDVPSVMGKAFSDSHSVGFDGSSQYFSVADNATLDDTSAVSVSTWVKFNNTSGNQTIAAKWQVGAKQQWVLQLDSSSHISWWTGDGGSGATNQLTSNTTIGNGTWYHIVATATSGAKKLYINGSLDNSNTGGTMGLASSTPVTVGSKMDSSGTFFEYLNGSVDDTRIYSRTLNAAEASELASGTETSATWTGATSTAFGTASNWDVGAVPDPFTNIIIGKSANRAILGQTSDGASVTVKSGGTLDLSGHNLNLHDTSHIENHGTVISQNSESGTNLDTSDGTVMYTNTTDKSGLVFGNSYHDVKFNDGLLGYWKLDETSAGSTGTDSSGYGYDATPQGSTLPTPSTTIPGTKFANSRSAVLDGSSSYYNVSGGWGGTSLTQATVSAWYKISADTGNLEAIVEPTDSSFIHIQAGTSGNNEVYTDTGAVDLPLAPIAPGGWHQITVTTKSGNTCEYLDGVLQGTCNAKTYGYITSTSSLQIGRGFGSARYLDGNVDDVRIYNRALSPTEASSLGSGEEPHTSLATTTLASDLSVGNTPSLNSDLAGYYKLDEVTNGAPIIDSSNYGNTGTAQGTGGANNLPQPSSTTAPLKFGDARSLTFDGTDDYVSIPDAPQLELKNNFTISAWVKPSSLTQQGQILAKSDANGMPATYSLYMDNSGHPAFQIYNGAFRVVSGTSALSTSSWTHIMGTYDGTQMKLYVNGASVGTPLSISTPNINNAPLTIGGFSDAQRFNGSIDDVRLYNRLLSSGEISALSGGSDSTPGDLTLNSGTLDVSTSNYGVGLFGDFINNGGVFGPEQGTVTLGGSNQSINSSNTFYNLTKTPSAADTLTFGQGSTTTITHYSYVSGPDPGSLALRSSTSGSQWKLSLPNFTSYSYDKMIENVTISDSELIASAPLGISNSTDGGNNTNWDFAAPVASNLGPTQYVNGSWGSDSTPTLNFDVSDSDSTNVHYVVEIDNNSDFSSPEVAYQSDAVPTGSVSFTVGQSGGTYDNGAPGMTLPDGTYYLVVSAYDDGNLLGNNIVANGGAAAFKVDTAAPTNTGTPTLTTPSNDNTPTLSWTASTDSGSGLADISYSIEWSQDPGFSGLGGDAGISTNSYTIPWALADGTWYFHVRAIDKANNTSAWVSTGAITIDTVSPAAPTTTQPSGIHKTSFTFQLSDSDGTVAGIYYTTNGSTPTNASTHYTGGNISVTRSETIKAVAYDASGNASGIMVANYIVDGTVPNTPIASVRGGTYTTAQLVSLRATDNSGGSGIDAIYYTIDGSTPTASSTKYSSAIPVNKSETLKAIAYDKARYASGVMTESYVLTNTTSGAVNSSSPDKRSLSSATSRHTSTSTKKPATDQTEPPTVHFQNDTNSQHAKPSDNKNTSAFLGLGWWWIAVLGGIAAISWAMLGMHSHKSLKQ